MRNSSETIGTLAAALAKAQSELTNPQKTLTATIISPFPREEARTFRYASLASGLDIVRKWLSQHAIAVIQTTTIDAGLVRLITTLAHSCGEWMSSDWPVCPISDTASPHKMGAALTYARRYGLFTLVGIAGEDDLDAPNLAASPGTDSNATRNPELTKQAITSRTAKANPTRPPLRSAESATLRDRLVGEIRELESADVTTSWAIRSLPLKNALSTSDAEVVEEAFRDRLAFFDLREPTNDLKIRTKTSRQVPADAATPAATQSDGGTHVKSRGRAQPIPKLVRIRNKEHLRFVASQPCLVCGRTPSDAHHVKFAQPVALGRKVGDDYTVPICRVHHRALHIPSREKDWWDGLGIDPMPIALSLWQKTQGMAASNSTLESGPAVTRQASTKRNPSHSITSAPGSVTACEHTKAATS
jgi:hypothetical protein